MGITVREVLEAEALHGIRLLSGPEGLDREVTGITIIEAPDIVRFIDGGEILLTALYAFKTSSLDKFEKYILEIVDKNVSAIMLKLGRNVEEADAKVALLLAIAGENHIPVIEVPFEMSFRDILVFVLGNLFNEEVMRLKYFKATHDNFESLMLSESEEEGEDSLYRILDALEKMIGNPIAVFDRRRNCLAATADAPTSLVIREDAAPFEVEAFSNTRYLRQSHGDHFQYLLTFPVHYRHKVTLVITERDQSFGVMDSIAVESAVSAFRNEFARMYSVREVEKKYQNDIMYKLLSGEMPSSEEIGKYSRMLGIPVKGSCRTVVFGVVNTDPGGERPEDYKDQIAVTDFLRDTIGGFLPGAKLQSDLDYVAMIQPVDSGQTEKDPREALCRVLEHVQREISAFDGRLLVRIGVGREVEGLASVQRSYEEAKKAWEYADIAAEISGTADARVTFYSDLGIFTLLVEEKDPTVLMEYVPKGLQRLCEVRKSQREDLLLTLKTYLDRNLNLSKTAQALYIHYKTASYRIEKIAGITGIDFENPNEVLAYRIGFVIIKMAEKLEK